MKTNHPIKIGVVFVIFARLCAVRNRLISSEFAICHVVRHGNMNSIQNPSTVTNPTMEPYCRPILLPLTLPCRTT